MTGRKRGAITIARRRLRIGHPSQSHHRFEVWIPSTVRGNLKLTVPTGTTPTLAHRTNGNVVLASTAGVLHTEWECDLADGAHGWYDVDLDSSQVIQCDFSQSGHARTGAGPWIPWTFWFWPYGRDSAAAGDVMRRFARLTGQDPDAADTWETTNHHVAAYNFEGHCHGAANASALFQEPAHDNTRVTDNTSGRYEDFSRAELKLLAAEYYTNFGQEQTVWELKGSSAHRMDQNRMCQEAERFYLLGYLKPGGTIDRPTLVAALRDDNIADADGWADWFQARAVRFPNQVGQSFGQAAASYFQTLLDQIGVAGQPLISNIRSGHAADGPASVWNQAVYKYKATYQESTIASATSAWRIMDIRCTVLTNDDRDVGDAVTPADDSMALRFENDWRIVFDVGGRCDPGSTRGLWRSCQRRAAGGGGLIQVYAPTDLTVLQRCVGVRQVNGDAQHEGNPHVTRYLEGVLPLVDNALAPP